MEEGKEGDRTEKSAEEKHQTPRNLREATNLLKKEALNQYKQKLANQGEGDQLDPSHNQGDPSGDQGDPSGSPKKINLKDATSILRAEALRRYRRKHKGSLDRAEQEMEEALGQSGRRSKKSPAPGANTPDVEEEEEGDDVFYPPRNSLVNTPIAEKLDDYDEFDDEDLDNLVDAEDTPDKSDGDGKADAKSARSDSAGSRDSKGSKKLDGETEPLDLDAADAGDKEEKHDSRAGSKTEDPETQEHDAEAKSSPRASSKASGSPELVKDSGKDDGSNAEPTRTPSPKGSTTKSPALSNKGSPPPSPKDGHSPSPKGSKPSSPKGSKPPSPKGNTPPSLKGSKPPSPQGSDHGSPIKDDPGRLSPASSFRESPIVDRSPRDSDKGQSPRSSKGHGTLTPADSTKDQTLSQGDPEKNDAETETQQIPEDKSSPSPRDTKPDRVDSESLDKNSDVASGSEPDQTETEKHTPDPTDSHSPGGSRGQSPVDSLGGSTEDLGQSKKISSERGTNSDEEAPPIGESPAAGETQDQEVEGGTQEQDPEQASETQATEQNMEPEGQTTEPEGQMTEPEGQTTGPEGQTTAPEGQTTEPEGQTTEPEGQTTEPEGQTSEPEGQTTEPEGQTTEPEGQTTEPEGQTTEPEGQTSEPEGQTTEPEGQTTKPEGQTTEPEGQTTEPEGQTSEPEGQANESDDQPKESDDQPKKSDDQPKELEGQTNEPEAQTNESETEPAEPSAQAIEPEDQATLQSEPQENEPTEPQDTTSPQEDEVPEGTQDANGSDYQEAAGAAEAPVDEAIIDPTSENQDANPAVEQIDDSQDQTPQDNNKAEEASGTDDKPNPEEQPEVQGQTDSQQIEGQDENDEQQAEVQGQTVDQQVEGQTGDQQVEGQTGEQQGQGQMDDQQVEGQGQDTVRPEVEGQTSERPGPVGADSVPTAEGEGQESGEQEAQEDGEEKKAADGLDPATRGDEDEIQSEASHMDDNEPRIPDDHFYNYDDHVSQPMVTEESGLPQDLLTLHHSFGYDSHKRANLHILDQDTAVFAAGNLVELLNLKTKEQTYIRSTSGGGVGAIAVHPSNTYFAVAEKGSAPNINIYEYPSLKLHRILRGGTEQSYAYIDFSPDGKLLASVGGDPDYMLTLWDWKQEKVVLRSKAFSQDVFRVTFSAELEGQLTSSGTGHIRFWKKAHTFTGLKLQGQLGKFGKKEISDIEGYVELPDGKVLSGTESGNLILWDGGLIKVEICRKNKKPCHNGTISQVIMDEGELMTVGVDGYIRVWDFETIDTADVTDEADLFEMDPMNEMKVSNDVQLKSIVKSVDPEEPTMWYAQDANGGIWKLDLSFSFTSLAPEKVMSYHAGPITGCSTSPNSHLSATTGVDHSVRVYDYLTKTTLCTARYNQPGTSVLWVPEVVDPKGATILAGFMDGVVRVLNFQKHEETQHRKHVESTELLLKQAFKPHNGSVTAMAIDPKGEILATGGDDCTVFFLNIGSNYEPIGFIKTPSAVTHLQWSPGSFKRATLLVCCKDGQVMEVESPESGNFDTSHSFQISGLPIKTHVFKSIKSRLRHEEELARIAKEEEEKRKKEEEERRIRIERGLETESEQGDDDDAKEDEQEEWSPYIPPDPSPILYGFHAKDEGKVWLSMGEFDAGYLYEVEFTADEDKGKQSEENLYEPTRAIPVRDSQDVPARCIKFSTFGKQMALAMGHSASSGKYLLMGMEDGSIRIQPLLNDDVGLMGSYWTLNIHDNHYGKITHLSTSHDDRFLLTVGEDGNFFVFEIMDEGKIEERVAAAKAKIPSARKELAEKKIDDIDDPKAYSIEDAKQKSEHDKMIRLAETKKANVRQTVKQLREQFRKLLDKNSQLPEHLRLDRKEFEMDPEIRRQLARKVEEKVEVVHKEMAWEEEKHRLALEKLRARFKDVVECERIVVKAFLTTHEVCSFRASKLSDDFYAAKAEMERRRTTLQSRDEASRQATQDLLAAQRQGTDLQGDGQGDQDSGDSKIMTSLKGSMGERINKALAKVEEKKRKRAARKAMWEELYATKPDDDYEDPADLHAIKEAKENMGDYKLKSANDYVVPDHLRMNAEKARARLILLKELIHKHKYDFNQHLLSLRDKKIQIIDEIRVLVGQLDAVQGRLDKDQAKPLPKIPRLHPEEMPEKKYEYTRETLLKFKEDMVLRKEQAAKGIQTTDGFGGFGGGAEASDPRKYISPTPSAPHLGYKQMSHLTSERTMDPDWSLHRDIEQMSDLEKQLKKAEEIRLLYERDYLFKKIDELLKNFDAELRCLRHDKFKLDIDLKNADLRHVTLFEELLLLKDFEKQENTLAAKVESKQQEKLDMQAKVIEVQQKLESKKKDIEKQQEKEKALHATFITSLGENNKFGEYLTKVFKKRIKRSKKKTTEGDGSDDDSDDDSDDESDWSESEEESDSEAGGYDLDVCPPGCDQNLYDNTCAIREKRLDIEEDLVEEKKSRDAMNKELEALQKKAKVIDGALKNAEQELEAFQLEKQQKLNELDVVVTMKLHQLQHVVNGVLPQDLSQCLVFESAGVVRLQHRIKELEHEKGLQKRQQKDAKKKHIQLIKDRRLFESRIQDMEDQCNKMMLQKFGRIVDLEKLETVTVNRQLEELKEKLRAHEMQCAAEITGWDEKIFDCKDNITDLIRENTKRLDQLNMLLGEKKDFERELDSRQKSLGSEFSGARKSDLHERQRLIQLVHLQAQEVEALKEEIMLLSRKGGHILPPAQPPMPHSAQGH